MQVSENTLKWLMRFYPPLFLQRIWVKKFDKGFTGVEVKIAKSIWNINYNRSIFGGTIFSGADPFHPILYHELLSRLGYKTTIWVKRSEIEFVKPAYGSLFFKIHISALELSEICDTLKQFGKVLKPNKIEIFDTSGQLCSLVTNEIYIRYLQET